MIGVASAALAIFVSVIRLQLFYPNLASAYKFVYAFVLAAAVCFASQQTKVVSETRISVWCARLLLPRGIRCLPSMV